MRGLDDRLLMADRGFTGNILIEELTVRVPLVRAAEGEKK